MINRRGPKPGTITGATDQQLYDGCERVWTERHRWPSRDNVGLSCNNARFSAARKRWAADHGLEHLSGRAALSFNGMLAHERICSFDELKARFDELWANGQGRWPTRKLTNLRCGSERFIAARNVWATEHGLKAPRKVPKIPSTNIDYTKPLMQALAPKPKPVKAKQPRTERAIAERILKRWEGVA